jgi:hypothetical protein
MANKSRLWIIIASTLTLIVLGIGVFALNQNRNKETSNPDNILVENKSETQPDTTDENKQDLVKFSLYREEGEVSYKSNLESSYQALSDEEIQLADKSFIKTGVGALAHVIFEDNSMISLDENTEIQVLYDNTSRNIAQNSGNTWHRIQKLTDNSAYQVETSNTLATVRGTIFGVKVENPAQTSLYVLESKVEVSQTALENGKKVNKNTQMVTDGKHIGVPDFGDNKNPLLTDIPEEKKQSVWFKRNRFIDEDYKKIPSVEILKKIKNDANFRQKLKEIREDKKEESKISNIGSGLGTLGKLLQASPEINEQTFSNPTSTLEALDASNYSCDELAGVVDFTVGLSALEQSGQIPSGTIQSLKNYYSELSNFCKDGKLDATEIARLSVLAQAMSKNFGSLADPDAVASNPNNATVQDPKAEQTAAYTTEIQNKLAQWATIDPQTQSAELCELYSQTNVSIIVSQFVAIEKKYNQPSTVANKVQPLISEIAISCRDGAIDSLETQEIAKVYPNEL